MMQEKQRAFINAYQACEARFVKYCTALAYGKMDAEDLVQDVLLSAYEHFDRIKHKDQLIRYLIRAARNRSISHWHRSRYQTELLDKHTQQLFTQAATPDILLDVQLLYQKLDQLPDKQRDAFVLFEVCGFSLKEIAAIQDSGINTVKSHLNRARKKLRYLMGEKPKSRWMIGILFGSSDHFRSVVFSFKQSFFHLKSVIMYSLSTLGLVGSMVLLIPTLSSPKITSQQSQVATSQLLDHSWPKEIIRKKVKPKVVINPAKTIRKVDKKKPSPIFIDPIPRINKTTQLSKPNMPIAGIGTLPSFTNHQPQTTTVNCEKLGHISGIKTFKRRLLKMLSKDDLVRSVKLRNRLAFKGQIVTINKKVIPQNLQEKYREFLYGYGITPCPERIVEMTKDYIVVGRMVGKKFKGQISGKIDLMYLGID